MKRKMKKNKIEFTFVKSRGFLMLVILFVFILILTFFFGDSGIVEIIKTQNKIETLKANITGLQAEKEKLENEIKELEDDPLALEKKAREKLWLMKKNEKVIVIVKQPEKGKQPRGAGSR